MISQLHIEDKENAESSANTQNYLTANDEELAGFVKKRDRAAYEELIRRYQNKLFPYLIRLLRNEEDALDIVQDTFLKVYENIQGFDEQKKFSSWLYRIAHNTGINHLNKHSRSLKMDFEFMTHLVDRQQVDKFLARNLRSEEQEDLMALVHQLKPKYKEMVVLFYYEDKSYEEISDILQLSISTVGVRLNRAKKQLKNLYLAVEKQIK